MCSRFGRYLRSGSAITWQFESTPAACSAHSSLSFHNVSKHGQNWKGIHADKALSRDTAFWRLSRGASSSGLLGAVTPAPSKLDAIIRLEEWKSLETDQVVQLWDRYYDDRASEAPGSITAQQWSLMQQRMKECPFSLLPLHKEKPADASSGSESFVMFLAQAQLPQHILFTPLIEYQTNQANAVPHMVCTFYTELVASKDVCLARCDVTNMVHLSKDESVQLLGDTVACYTKPELYEHVKAVNHGSDKFDLKTFLKDLRDQR